MWDPVSVFYCMWILNSGLPPARLNVTETIELKETSVINQTMNRGIHLREGV